VAGDATGSGWRADPRRLKDVTTSQQNGHLHFAKHPALVILIPMTKAPHTSLPVAGSALPLAGHAAILPELTGWAGQQAPDSGLTPAQLAAIFAHSRHLQTLARAHPDLLASATRGGGAAEIGRAIEACETDAIRLTDEPQMMAALRRLRQRSALCVALADMADSDDIESQMRWLSDAADAAVRCAVTWLFRDAARRRQITNADAPAWHGGAGCGWTVLALGKLGAGELNYSSDIDLVLLHDPIDNPLPDGNTSQRFYVEMARGLVRLLSTATRDGIGWRVDLRLRPDPGATAVSIQREAAIGYYESIARTWERAAFIRARPIAGDPEMGRNFLTELQPFIWRRTLDYTVMDDMKMMLRRPAAGLGWEGYNLKTGPNGIRSIEFLTHVLQLVGGGRAPALRVGSTLPALRALAAESWITGKQCERLGALYLALRRAEHRLQMIADAQTHMLPRTREGIDEVARFMGHDGAGSFLAALTAILDEVARHTSHRLFDETADEGADATGDDPAMAAGADPGDAPLFDDEDRLAAWLEARGFRRPADIAAVLSGWMAGRIAATRGERARTLLSRIMPPMLSHLSGAKDADSAFAAFAGFVEGLPASVQIFSLLDHNRDLTRLLGDILVLSPRLGERLRRHPMLFDLVLFAAFFEPLPATAILEEELRTTIADQPTELALDTVTRVTRERQFRAEVQHLSGVADRRALGTALADIAEAAIRVTRDLAIADMQRRHGSIEGDLAVLAMGRLGLGDLTATSDLDLVFVWDAPAEAGSTGIGDGQRRLSASSYFTRLAQTLANWLGGATGEGKLFTIDLRLRPDGEKSGLAPSLARLNAYYHNEAWLWEKLALGKARLVTPAAACGAALIDSLAATRTTALPIDTIGPPLHDMRRRLRASYGDADEWQLRKHPGGIGELDLLIQALRLLNADLFSNAAWPADAVLERLVEAGRLAPEDAEALGAAENLYADLHHALRFVVGTSATDPQALSAAARQFICTACDSPDFETLRGRIDAHKRQVEVLFDQLFPLPEG